MHYRKFTRYKTARITPAIRDGVSEIVSDYLAERGNPGDVLRHDVIGLMRKVDAEIRRMSHRKSERGMAKELVAGCLSQHDYRRKKTPYDTQDWYKNGSQELNV